MTRGAPPDIILMAGLGMCSAALIGLALDPRDEWYIINLIAAWSGLILVGMWGAFSIAWQLGAQDEMRRLRKQLKGRRNRKP